MIIAFIIKSWNREMTSTPRKYHIWQFIMSRCVHEHGTSTTQQTETIIKGNNYIYIYPTVSKAFTKIIIKNKDLPKINGGGRIWTKKR